MPAPRITLLLTSLPASLLAAGEAPFGSGGDPRPMLFWYIALAVPTLVSMAVGVLTIIEFFNRRGEASKAASLGGYVTHPQMNGELDKVYETVKRAVKDGFHDLKEEVEKMDRELTAVRNTGQANCNDIAHIEGRLASVPHLRRKNG